MKQTLINHRKDCYFCLLTLFVNKETLIEDQTHNHLNLKLNVVAALLLSFSGGPNSPCYYRNTMQQYSYTVYCVGDPIGVSEQSSKYLIAPNPEVIFWQPFVKAILYAKNRIYRWWKPEVACTPESFPEFEILSSFPLASSEAGQSWPLNS